jgi:hypothetical protein
MLATDVDRLGYGIVKHLLIIQKHFGSSRCSILQRSFIWNILKKSIETDFVSMQGTI